MNPAIIAAGISSLGQLAGGFIGSNATSAANAANVAMQEQANAANLAFAYNQQGEQQKLAWATLKSQEAQASINRDFAAAQAHGAMDMTHHLANKAMDFSASQAGRQMEFQERMANTAYQRAMGDMRKAGLNPILAYKQGGASAPGGAMGASSAGSGTAGSGGGSIGTSMGTTSAGQVAPRVTSNLEMARGLANMSQSALNAYQAVETIDNTSANTSRAQAETAVARSNDMKVQADTATAIETARKTSAETQYIDQQTKNAAIEEAIKKHGVNTAKAEAEIRTIEAEYAKKWGPGSWGQQGGTIERIWQRVREAMGNRSSDPASPARAGGASPNNNPPLLRDTPGHWLYKEPSK